jgi:hypothetical protein
MVNDIMIMVLNQDMIWLSTRIDHYDNYNMIIIMVIMIIINQDMTIDWSLRWLMVNQDMIWLSLWFMIHNNWSYYYWVKTMP